MAKALNGGIFGNDPDPDSTAWHYRMGRWDGACGQEYGWYLHGMGGQYPDSPSATCDRHRLAYWFGFVETCHITQRYY